MLYIRADANETIATGHVMRCLAIADAAKVLGEDTTFVVADEQATALVQQRGYQVIVLHTRWDDMEAELEILQNVIKEQKITSMLVDSYAVTKQYLEILSSWVHVAYLDDVNAFLYPVDMLICYANYWQDFDYPKRYPNAKLLLGTGYAPLRQVFCNCESKFVKPQVENLLLVAGGADRFHVSERLLEAIEKEKYHRIDVICGAYYTDYDKLCDTYKQWTNIHFHRAVKNMEYYMMQADMAISAGGSTLYELCACGTPTLSYSCADNQLCNVKKFYQDGVIDYLGDVRAADITGVARTLLSQYHEDASLRQYRSVQMQKQVDGCGAERIAKELVGTTLDF
jgi:UDP-2,4-diacetamido-2,4,6-trideoxy-beta-L-altropyranose hydrolase